MYLTMTIFLAKATKRTKGKTYTYWILKENRWDAQIKATKQRYIGFVGLEPILTEAQAREIAKAKDLALDQLRAVDGLKIVHGAPKPKIEKR